MTAPHERDENARFWEERGARDDVPAHAVTLMMEHARYNAYVHAREVALLERLIGDFRPRVLDVGCGVGRLALALAPRAATIVALDDAASLVERGRAAAAAAGTLNVRFEKGSFDALEPLGTFDVVLLSGVLNYLDDDACRKAIAACRDRLRPGGILYQRNVCAVERRFYRVGSANNAPTTHRTASEYIRMAAEAELRVEHAGWLFPPLCLPNMVYMHALPRWVRDGAVAGALLDRWFALENRTAAARLRWLGPLYGPAMRVLGKTTAFHVIIARRP